MSGIFLKKINAMTICNIRTYYKITALMVVVIYIFAAIGDPPIYQIFTLITPANQDGVVFTGFTILPITILIFNYIVTTYLGYGILSHLITQVPVSFTVKIFSGFMFGYVGILALARIFSLYLCDMTFYLAVVFTAAGTSYFLQQQKNALPRISTNYNNDTCTWMDLLVSLAGAIFIISALCLQVTQGEFSWVGHGSGQYAHLLPDWTEQGMKHFPLVFQHHDELLYHFWATLFYIPKFDPIIPWWITLSLIKLSIYSFIYIAFCHLKIKKSLAFIMSSFFMFGTSSAFMTKYYLLFDSSNPIFFTVHSGRIVGVGVVIFLLLEVFSTKSYDNKIKSYIPYLFLGFGITTTSLSNGVWLLFISTILYWITRVQPQTYENDILNLISKHKRTILCIVPIMVILLLLLQPFTPDYISYPKIYVRLILSLIYIYFCVVALHCYLPIMRSSYLPLTNHSRLLLLIIVILLAMLVFGNMTSLPLYNTFPNFSKLFFHEINPQILSTASIINNISWTWSTLIGDHREKLMTGHLYMYNTVFDFAAYYGVFIFACLTINGLIIRVIAKQKQFTPQDAIFFGIFLCLITTIPFLFFFMNYIGLSDRAWLKSRFLEIPVNLILFFSFYYASRFFHKREKTLLVIILIIYCVVPFIVTQRPERIWINARSLFDAVRLPSVKASSQLQNYNP